ncbi:MAG: chorismate synthase [Methanomassiliicoccales archaeon]
MMNTIGHTFKVTLFGSSHGEAVGCVLDGVPPGLTIDIEEVQREVDLRKPSDGIGTPRKEADIVEIVSGLRDGKASGTPLTIFIRNENRDSDKYKRFKNVPRPGHADMTQVSKYGQCVDIRGGGQFSGRMTAPLVAAGAIARALLSDLGIEIAAYTQSIGKVVDVKERSIQEIISRSRGNDVRAANEDVAETMRREILEACEDHDSVGGVVSCICDGVPVGLGEPFFDTVEGELSKIMFAIPAVKGIEFGAGFRAACMRGSEHNDPFVVVDGRLRTAKNDAGGVLGGISNGMPITFRVAFKPTASIAKQQRSVDRTTMEETDIKVEGRHDPCIVPRAVIVVEAAAALVLADLCVRGGFVD